MNPGDQIYVCQCKRFIDLTDVTLVDEDINSIHTDDTNKAIPGKWQCKLPKFGINANETLPEAHRTQGIDSVLAESQVCGKTEDRGLRPDSFASSNPQSLVLSPIILKILKS